MKIFVIPSIFFFLQETFIENKKEIDKYFDIKTTIFPEKELSFQISLQPDGVNL